MDSTNRVEAGSSSYVTIRIPVREKCRSLTFNGGKRDESVYASNYCKICRDMSVPKVVFTGSKIICPKS
ncbi:MAG: hypothetical protein ACE5FT_05415 [Candidatus Nanoarchaeia archaeon]